MAPRLNRTIQLRVVAEDVEILDENCRRLSMTRSDFLRQAIERFNRELISVS